jgi:hypothetical protein
MRDYKAAGNRHRPQRGSESARRRGVLPRLVLAMVVIILLGVLGWSLFGTDDPPKGGSPGPGADDAAIPLVLPPPKTTPVAPPSTQSPAMQ